MEHNLEAFEQDLQELHISLDKRQMCQFMKYYDLLVEWNSFMNLTAITDFDEVIKKHFIDSLTLVNGYDLSRPVKIIDIGTGAGFPGIPIKIAFPNCDITLLDSLNKRIKFLNHVIDELELTNITALHGRAEDYAKEISYREQYDLCVSRAVANLSTLSEYCLPFVKQGGQFISYKSEKITEEANDAKGAIYLLGGKVNNQIEFHLPHSDIYRNLFVINKVNKTPGTYPRKAGLPSKEPLR